MYEIVKEAIDPVNKNKCSDYFSRMLPFTEPYMKITIKENFPENSRNFNELPILLVMYQNYGNKQKT